MYCINFVCVCVCSQLLVSDGDGVVVVVTFLRVTWSLLLLLSYQNSTHLGRQLYVASVVFECAPLKKSIRNYIVNELFPKIILFQCPHHGRYIIQNVLKFLFSTSFVSRYFFPHIYLSLAQRHRRIPVYIYTYNNSSCPSISIFNPLWKFAIWARFFFLAHNRRSYRTTSRCGTFASRIKLQFFCVTFNSERVLQQNCDHIFVAPTLTMHSHNRTLGGGGTLDFRLPSWRFFCVCCCSGFWYA